MHIDRLPAWQVVAKLADRFEKGHCLDIANRAADLAKYEIEIVVAAQHEVLDLVGDVRNDLHGRTEIVAAPLLLDDVLVDTAGGDVVVLIRGAPGKPLVMAEVEISLGSIVRHKDFAVLIRRHRAGIDIEIGIELTDAHAISASLQKSTESCRSYAFSERGNHAACDEYISRHGSQGLAWRNRFRQKKIAASMTFEASSQRLAQTKRAGDAGPSITPVGGGLHDDDRGTNLHPAVEVLDVLVDHAEAAV